jgi:hypothetical protein
MGRVEEVVQAVDFRAGQSFGEAQGPLVLSPEVDTHRQAAGGIAGRLLHGRIRGR